MMYRIMLVGPSGSGKDTMASQIVKIVPNCHVLSFATEVKRISEKILVTVENEAGVSLARLRQMQAEDDSSWRSVMRSLWQWVGTDLMRDTVDKDFWIQQVAKQMAFVQNFHSNHYDGRNASFVVTDCRFRNECQWGIDNNFVIVRVSGGWRNPTGIVGHRSEQEHTELSEHLWYKNKGSLEDMNVWISEVLIPFCSAYQQPCL